MNGFGRGVANLSIFIGDLDDFGNESGGKSWGLRRRGMASLSTMVFIGDLDDFGLGTESCKSLGLL
jgi:hypothetical protein